MYLGNVLSVFVYPSLKIISFLLKGLSFESYTDETVNYGSYQIWRSLPHVSLSVLVLFVDSAEENFIVRLHKH
jgi:hypothetical protein